MCPTLVFLLFIDQGKIRSYTSTSCFAQAVVTEFSRMKQIIITFMLLAASVDSETIGSDDTNIGRDGNNEASIPFVSPDRMWPQGIVYYK